MFHSISQLNVTLKAFVLMKSNYVNVHRDILVHHAKIVHQDTNVYLVDDTLVHVYQCNVHNAR